MYPIVKVIKPSVLNGQENGKLSASILYDVPGGGKLIGLTYWWYAVMSNEAAKAGFKLTYTPGGCYRTYASQVNLFNSRYEKVSYAVYLLTPSARRKYWPGQGHYRLRQLPNGRYPAMAAVPGTSNHGLGLAIDLALGDSPKVATSLTPAALTWLRANAAKYGFSWEAQSEPWHVRYVAGDAGPK